eukprot:COSAG01_NODE_27361_length_687_cov_15.654762_1_plen_45_part_10
MERDPRRAGLTPWRSVPLALPGAHHIYLHAKPQAQAQIRCHDQGP